MRSTGVPQYRIAGEMMEWAHVYGRRVRRAFYRAFDLDKDGAE